MSKVILLSELAESVQVSEADLEEFFTILGFSLSKNKGKTSVSGSFTTEDAELDAVQTARQFVNLAQKLSAETDTAVSIVTLAEQVTNNQQQNEQSNENIDKALPPVDSTPSAPKNSSPSPDIDALYEQLTGAKSFSVKNPESQKAQLNGTLETYRSLFGHLAEQNEAIAPMLALLSTHHLITTTRQINPFTDPRTAEVFESLKKMEIGTFVQALLPPGEQEQTPEQMEISDLAHFLGVNLNREQSAHTLSGSSN